MKLHPVYATGIKAYCSDMIVDPGKIETVYFMSICGYQATVKGVIANFLESYGISTEIHGTEHYLMRSGFGYKTQLKKLPSGLVHAVIFPKLALPKNDEENQNSFFLFSKDQKSIPSLFFRHLDEKTEIPLHPTWAEWLWQVFEEQEDWLCELRTLAGNYSGYLFRFNPEQLHDLISRAIREKNPEVIRCMEWKGGNENGSIDIT